MTAIGAFATVPDDPTLLAAWERSLGRPRPAREVAFLAATSGLPADEIAKLPVGERDARLLDVRVAILGPTLECEAACPECGERLELALDARALVPTDGASGADIGTRRDDIRHGRYAVVLRAPTSADLAAVAASGSSAAAELVGRCIVTATHDGVAVDASDLPADVVAACRVALAGIDPAADLELDLRCPACGHVWRAPFDIATFLLAEMDVYALRLLRQVHELARAYGWNEDEVLALPRERRRRYLGLALA